MFPGLTFEQQERVATAIEAFARTGARI